MADLISIIVPIYNLENYIEKCILSIMQQSYQELEIILVDDGSTDGSGRICDDYSQKDDRIIVMHRPNGGVSRARNAGLDAMKGAYYLFVDGDDWLAEDFVEQLYDEIVEGQADIAFGNHVYFSQKPLCEVYGYKEKRAFDRQQAVQDLLFYSSTVAGKLYKTASITNMRFPEGIKVAEDSLTAIHVLLGINKMVYVPDAIYYRLVREGSASRSKKISKAEVDALEAHEKIAALIHEHITGVDDYLNCYMVKQYGAVLLKPGVSEDKARYKRIKKRYGFWYKRRGYRGLESKGMDIRYLLLKISPGMYRLLKKVTGE